MVHSIPPLIPAYQTLPRTCTKNCYHLLNNELIANFSSRVSVFRFPFVKYLLKRLRQSHQKPPIHIIELEILPKLPAKSVCRFTCVCKQWQSLLSSKDFRQKNHHHITTDNPRNHQKLVLIDAPAGTYHTLDCGTTPTYRSGTTGTIPFGSSNSGMHVLATLDGLVCVAIWDRLMFWNPLTGAYKQLAESRVHTSNQLYIDAFGLYSDSANDYKLLHLVRYQRYEYIGVNHQATAYIYSLRLDSWRKISSFNQPQRYLRWPTYQWSPGTLAGQSLYFTVVSSEDGCIICFDVVAETFRDIQFPPSVVTGAWFNGRLVAINGCVHLCVAHHDIKNQFYVPSVDIDLWRMDGGGDDVGWIKVATCFGNEGIPFSLTPNCVVRHENWEVTWVFHKALVIVDVPTYKGESDRKFTYHGGSLYDSVRAIYVETLLSPNH